MRRAWDHYTELFARVVPLLVLLLSGRAEAESGSALTRLAQRVSSVIPTTPVFVAVTPLAGVTLAAADRTALDAKLHRVLGSAVSGSRARGEAGMSEEAARVRSRDLGLPLVLLQPTLKDGQLLVDVDLFEWELSFWARTRKPRGTVVRHASFSEPADAEIRRYLPRPPGLMYGQLRFRTPERGAIGVACGDVRGNGASELLVVGRRALYLGSLRGPFVSSCGPGERDCQGRGSFLLRKSVPWAQLSPLSPHPLRAPLAGAWIQPGRAWVGTSDRLALVQLDAQLGAAKFGPAAWPLGEARCHAFTATGLATEAQPCVADREALPKPTLAAEEAPSHDAVAFLAHTDERGIVKNYQLVSDPGGRLTLTIESPLEQRQVHQLPRGGAQVALADLDGDAVVEAITTTAAESDQDAILVHSLTPRGPVLRTRRPLGPVRALAVCPFEGQNPQRVVVLLDDEIRILE